VDSARICREEADERPDAVVAGRRRPATPVDQVLAMQRGVGNQAVARVLARTVTLPRKVTHDPEVVTAEQMKKLVEAKVTPGLLPELDEELGVMAGPDFTKHFADEPRLVNGVLTRMEQRYMAAIAISHPKATAIVTKHGGVNTLAWAVRLTKFPADLEELLTKLGPLVESEDLEHQMKDVFGKGEPMGQKLAGGGAKWISGKQAQIDGLIAELRVAGRISPESLTLTETEKMRFGKKFTAKVPEKTEGQGQGEGESTSAQKLVETSVKADLSYTDSDGVLWFVEIAEGVEGLRKKVTRLDAHQRAAYQTVAQSKGKTTRLKYVCVDPDGWMKLCNLDRKNPSPVSEMARGGWILELGGQTLTTQQLELAGHNALLLYGNYTANTIGRHYRKVWPTLTAFAADTNPVSAFTQATQLQPDAVKEIV
jgi:hypothetical protein